MQPAIRYIIKMVLTFESVDKILSVIISKAIERHVYVALVVFNEIMTMFHDGHDASNEMDIDRGTKRVGKRAPSWITAPLRLFENN